MGQNEARGTWCWIKALHGDVVLQPCHTLLESGHAVAEGVPVGLEGVSSRLQEDDSGLKSVPVVGHRVGVRRVVGRLMSKFRKLGLQIPNGGLCSGSGQVCDRKLTRGGLLHGGDAGAEDQDFAQLVLHSLPIVVGQGLEGGEHT